MVGFLRRYIVLLVGLCVMFSSIAHAGNIIKETIGDMAVVKKSFAVKGHKDLRGYIVARKGDPADMRIIFSLDNKAVILGKILVKGQGGKLEELSNVYDQKYLAGPRSKNVYNRLLEKGTWISEGKDTAPHKVFIFFDANCIFCHVLYENLHKSDLLKSGQLQVRWVPIAFLKKESIAKGAMLIYKRNEAGIMEQNENNFNKQQELGSIKGLEFNQKDKAVQDAYARLRMNNNIFALLGGEATPAWVYKTPKGEYSDVLGVIPTDILKGKIKDFSSKW